MASVRTVRRPRSSGSARATTRRRSSGRRNLSVRFTEPMDARTADAFQRDRRRQAGRRARSPGPRATPSSCSTRPRPCRTARRSSSDDHARGAQPGRRPDRRGGQRHVHGQGEAQAASRKPASTPDPHGRRRRRVRQLGRGRALLPAAHELHADRRLGHVVRELLVARAAATSRPLALSSGHQPQGLPAVREAPRDAQPVQPLHRRQPRRPAPPRRLHELPLGGEPRLPVGQPVRRRPRLAPLLPEREVVQRRPLREPDERGVRPGRDRRLGVRRPRPPRGRLLPPLTASRGATGTIGRVTRRAA